MKTAESIAWFKRTFGDRIAAGVEGTPFTLDLVAAIANQETGYIWGPLVTKGLPKEDILRFCVGDTLDSDRGRSCFPRNKSELLAAPRGAEMFAIARQALLDMAKHVRGYEGAAANPNKFCHGYGIFQYDIQFFKENPDYFLNKSWGNFDACLAQFVAELKQALKRQGWASKNSLTDEERVYVAIAYNKGTADCKRGFQQGHKSDGRCYGENVYDFLRTAQGIPFEGVAAAVQLPALPVPAVARKPRFQKLAPVFEVNVQEVPLRLRSEPRISTPNPGSNVIARLPRGLLVQRVSKEETGEFVEIETILESKKLRGFASTKFLRLVKRATPVKKVKPARKTKKPRSTRKTKSPEKRTKTRKKRSKPKTAGSRKTTRKTKRPKRKKPAKPSPPKGGGDMEKPMDIEAIIRAVQKELGLGVDGKAGPRTWKAIYLRLKGKKPDKKGAPVTTRRLPPAATGEVDARSEKTIATLEPEVQPYARALVLKAAALGITIKVISGLRTYDEQNELYAQGRTKRGRRVTNARGGYSNHNFGIAFDIGIFDGSSYVPESPKYKAVGALGVELGLEWGGNWKTIKDEPHFQLRPSWAADMSERDLLGELRSRKEGGQGYYA